MARWNGGNFWGDRVCIFGGLNGMGDLLALGANGRAGAQKMGTGERAEATTEDVQTTAYGEILWGWIYGRFT